MACYIKGSDHLRSHSLSSTTSNFSFSRVDKTSKGILSNLLELYCHDMSQWLDVETDERGTFSKHYNVLQCWENGGSVFIAKKGVLPIGFAIVQPAQQFTNAGGWDLKEFFVLRKYRRTGAGQKLAKFVWDTSSDKWLVRVHSANRPAVPFWRTTIESYSNGKCIEDIRDVNGNDWFYFSFEGAASC
ncbi:MAG: hypothetical protein COA96_10565 [SAR86 cluster bacterium]|uniref:N-acetyltransferase domain-containing protein n=1 Tax=SAR86 cluster bacterium TaxID=2030880 RepID=A0A2A5AXL7_9GAMM|nr:MAG: hypothetical protein COA96_10565 [SAR86 cluster bacterium]